MPLKGDASNWSETFGNAKNFPGPGRVRENGKTPTFFREPPLMMQPHQMDTGKTYYFFR